MVDLSAKVRELVEPEYRKITWEHGWEHVKSVAQSASSFAPKVNADTDLCETAAYCHDLGRVVEKTGPEIGNTNHSNSSIPLTINLLQKIGASDEEMGIIVEAVAVHSSRLYTGKNQVAKVLRDCDKKDSLGPWGTLRCTRHHFRRDLVPTEDILSNSQDSEALKGLAQRTAEIVKADPALAPTYLNNLNFVLEWIDARMLDNPQAYDFLREGYEYSKGERMFLLSDVLARLSENSRDNPRQRAIHFFHDPSNNGFQFGVNMIQPDSYIMPHSRSVDERITHLTGRLCSLQFDDEGKLTRRTILDEGHPYMELPRSTFHTIISLEEDSSIGVTLKGPIRRDCRQNAPWACEEQGNYTAYFDSLKTLV